MSIRGIANIAMNVSDDILRSAQIASVISKYWVAGIAKINAESIKTAKTNDYKKLLENTFEVEIKRGLKMNAPGDNRSVLINKDIQQNDGYLILRYEVNDYFVTCDDTEVRVVRYIAGTVTEIKPADVITYDPITASRYNEPSFVMVMSSEWIA
jgi:hypothetical protein